MSERNARHIRNYYQTFLGRAPDQGGFDGYMAQAASGRALSDIRKEIATSQEAKDNVKRAAAAREQAAASAAQVSGLQSQISGFESRIADYESRMQDYNNRISGLQTQYQNALGQVQSWTDKANEYQKQASDWEDQFNKRTTEFEEARAEAQMYRDQAVGAQLRALRSGATAGGGNQTQGGGSLTGGRQSTQRYDDKAIEIEKNIKAESGALSTKGPVVQKINTANRRQTAPQGAPNQNLASGAGGSGYYASRFG